jgi:transketolase
MDDVLAQRIKSATHDIRKKCLDVALAAGARATHFGGGISSVDILATLYFAVMNYDVDNPTWEKRDRFILSKGHGVLGYYATLAEVGFLTDGELSTFEQNGTILPGHPLINKNKGIEFTNGSLGMGLAVGIGNAIAAKRKGLEYKTFVLLGDGECNEGSVWEAAMAAAHYELDNLIAIVDRNKYQLGGANCDIMNLGDLRKKFSSFGWYAIEIDGHDVPSIYMALNEDSAGKPKAIIANTIKGKGFSFSEKGNEWHHAVLTKKLYDLGVTECGEKRQCK